MPTPPKSFTDEQKAEAIRLVEAGVPRKEAAARIGCADQTLKGLEGSGFFGPFVLRGLF